MSSCPPRPWGMQCAASEGPGLPHARHGEVLIRFKSFLSTFLLGLVRRLTRVLPTVGLFTLSAH